MQCEVGRQEVISAQAGKSHRYILGFYLLEGPAQMGLVGWEERLIPALKLPQILETPEVSGVNPLERKPMLFLHSQDIVGCIRFSTFGEGPGKSVKLGETAGLLLVEGRKECL